MAKLTSINLVVNKMVGRAICRKLMDLPECAYCFMNATPHDTICSRGTSVVVSELINVKYHEARNFSK